MTLEHKAKVSQRFYFNLPRSLKRKLQPFRYFSKRGGNMSIQPKTSLDDHPVLGFQNMQPLTNKGRLLRFMQLRFLRQRVFIGDTAPDRQVRILEVHAQPF